MQKSNLQEESEFSDNLLKNLFYNLGYRSLGVDKSIYSSRETGFIFGGEYLHKLSKESSLIPFFEYSSIKNLSGIRGRDAQYSTVALIGNYRNWISSVTIQTRNIDKNYLKDRHTFDRQLQLSVGYKFTNNLTIDLSRAEIREDAKRASLMGINMSYVQKF